MTDDDSKPQTLARLLVDAMEDSIGQHLQRTDDLADFWHRATEECTMRLIVLKPELVRKVEPFDYFDSEAADNA